MAFVISANNLSAQKIYFEHLTVKDGLPQNTVQSIVKDKYGFIWFGTWNGLCRYDGYKFKNYSSIPGDSSSIANNRIHYIYMDSEGTLWVATFNSFICRYNYETDNFTRFKANQLPAAIRDSSNRLRNLDTFSKSAGFFRSTVADFHLSQTKEHVVFQTQPNIQGGLTDNNAYCAYRDNTGILWIGTATGGVNIADLNAKRFHGFPITSAGKKGKVAVRAILTDQSNIWLGTHDEGLICIDRETMRKRYLKLGAAGKNVRALFKDSFGNVWIGYREGLDIYNAKDKQFRNYFSSSNYSESRPYRFSSIAEDPLDQSIWIGTFNDILKYNRRTEKFEKQRLGGHFNNSNAVCLFFDSRNGLWIGTEYSGIIHLKRNPETNSWTDTVRYESPGTDLRLAGERVYSIAEDEFGNVWAGTTNGIARIDPHSGKVKVYSRQEGLADQYIAKILSDKQGNIWVSHKKGISKLNIKTSSIRNYTVKGSALGYEFVDGSGWIDKITGELYFGSVEGFVSFSPEEIVDNPHLPVIVLTELQVFNKPVEVGQTVNGNIVLKAPINLTKEITLTNKDRSFSIEFAALHYSESEKNQYAYMLEGQDRGWIQTDASLRVANYANLSAGRYTFKVKASNSDGVWNSVPATLQIIILPPWWKTGWAYFAYFILLLIACYMLYRLVVKKHEYDRQILTERLKAEKARELDEIKSRFFTNVSHEFRTPLTLIIDPLEKLLTGQFDGAKVSGYYDIMHRNARRLLGLINQFLDFRKLESGAIALCPKRQDIVLFVRNEMAAFEFQAEQRNIVFSLEAEMQELQFSFDADVVEKVLNNLISNAFKFTPKGGEIKVALKISIRTPEQVLLEVSDNGPGIPSESLDHIFEPFFQAKNNESYKTPGTGVGLALSKELITLHKGSVQVFSNPYVETRFSVILGNLEGGKIEEALHLTHISNSRYTNLSNNGFVLGVEEEPAKDTEASLVLIIEDNEDVRSYLRLNLISDYLILEACDGKEGLEKANETVPDLIISDVMMPEMDGIELCRKLKTDERTSHIPVILLTARQSEQFRLEGYETGADAYIGKPFSSALLLVRIKNLIETRKKLRELFNRSTGFNIKILGINPADKAFLSKLTQLVEDNMGEDDFDVEWLASALFMSRTQLYRKVKALTNQSVHEFVTTQRLNKAAGLLLENYLPVSEIAYLVGYKDSTSFSRGFQKQFGLTPKKYSQQTKTSSG